MPLPFSILFAKVLILVKAFINFDPKLEDAFDVFNVLVKVLIIVKAFMNFERKLKDAFSVFNVVGKSTDFTKGIHEL